MPQLSGEHGFTEVDDLFHRSASDGSWTETLYWQFYVPERA